MELRWILILAGIAILLFLYLSGRQRKPANGTNTAMPGNVSESAAGFESDPYQQSSMPGYQDSVAGSGNHAPSGQVDYQGGNAAVGNAAVSDARIGAHRSAVSEPSQPRDYGSYPASTAAPVTPLSDPLLDQQYGDIPRDPRLQYDPAMGSEPMGSETMGFDTMGFDNDPNDMSRPAGVGGVPQPDPYGEDFGMPSYDANGQPLGSDMQYPSTQQLDGTKKAGMFSALGQKLSIGQKFKGSRSASTNTTPMAVTPHGVESKLVTLHVVAPEGQVIHGPRLLALFEQRGYHYGEMDVFHSLHDGKIVFSMAKMVEPGTFDINNVASFETPGITMFLQLPGPVAADVAFDVLINEASEMAEALGCSILDDGHSTLSRQTVQHLRDDVHQFMHRQRRAEAVPS